MSHRRHLVNLQSLSNPSPPPRRSFTGRRLVLLMLVLRSKVHPAVVVVLSAWTHFRFASLRSSARYVSFSARLKTQAVAKGDLNNPALYFSPVRAGLEILAGCSATGSEEFAGTGNLLCDVTPAAGL